VLLRLQPNGAGRTAGWAVRVGLPVAGLNREVRHADWAALELMTTCIYLFVERRHNVRGCPGWGLSAWCRIAIRNQAVARDRR